MGLVVESERKKVTEKESNYCFYSKGNAVYCGGEFTVAEII